MGGVCNTPLHGYVQNLAGFRREPLSRFFGGRMLLHPTRVHEKFGGFHISAHGCAKNAPDFTHPNRDMPKSCPILDPNLWRGTFGGVCFCALHGYAQNPPDFRRKPLSQDISGRMQYAPTRVYEKFGGFHIPAHDMARNLAGFGLCHTT